MKLIHHEAPQGSEQWLAARRGLITGSRARDARERKRDGTLSAAALGYAMDLARERCGGLLVPSVQTLPMRIGSEQEPAARAAYEVETGELVDLSGLVTDDGMRYGVSPDGLVGDDGLIEIKTMVSSATLFRVVVDGDHGDYIDQIEMELWLLGRAWCDLVLWAPDLPRQLWIRRIWRDEARIERLAAEMTDFAGLVDSLAQRLADSMRDEPAGLRLAA